MEKRRSQYFGSLIDNLNKYTLEETDVFDAAAYLIDSTAPNVLTFIADLFCTINDREIAFFLLGQLTGATMRLEQMRRAKEPSGPEA